MCTWVYIAQHASLCVPRVYIAQHASLPYLGWHIAQHASLLPYIEWYIAQYASLLPVCRWYIAQHASPNHPFHCWPYSRPLSVPHFNTFGKKESLRGSLFPFHCWSRKRGNLLGRELLPGLGEGDPAGKRASFPGLEREGIMLGRESPASHGGWEVLLVYMPGYPWRPYYPGVHSPGIPP